MHDDPDFPTPTDPGDGPAPAAEGGSAAEPASESAIPAAALTQPGGPERLDSRVVPYWLVEGALGWVVFAAVCTGALVVFREEVFEGEHADKWWWVLVGGGSILGVRLVWSLVWPSLAFRRWQFCVGEDLLEARYGVIWHEEKIIPISRLQHVDLTRGPLERLFGLATLVVFTAGTEGASFRLPGLARTRAEDLRDRILVARGDDVI